MAFKHRPLTREQLERRTDQKSQIIDPMIDPKFKVFRPKTGLNTIRFMPPTWQNFQHWAYDVFIHRNVGPDNGSYLCLRRMLREPCPVCEEVLALDSAGDTEAGKQIYARKSRVAWVRDRAEPEGDPEIWIYGWTIDEDIAGRCFNKRTGEEIDILHPDDGFDVSFRRGNEKPFPKTSGMEIDRDPSPIDEDQSWQDHWLAFVEKNPIPDVLLYYEYDHIYRVLNGTGKKPSHSEEVDTRSSRRPPPPTDEPEERETRSGRRAPPPEDTDGKPSDDKRDIARSREPEPDEPERTTSRRRPPEDETQPEDRARQRDGEERQPATRRRTAPDPDNDGSERGNGHDAEGGVSQARRQLSNLRDEDRSNREREQPSSGGRRRPPPEEAQASTQRRRPPS